MKKLVVGGPTDSDVVEWYANACAGGGAKVDKSRLFATAANTGRIRLSSKMIIQMNKLRFKQGYRDHVRSLEDTYALFFNRVMAEATHRLGRTIQHEEIFAALAGMSEFDPRGVFIRIDGQIEYRFPYDIKEGAPENLSLEMIFDDPAALEVAPGTNPETVKIIAGNRARLSAVSNVCLVGRNRSEEMNWAASRQNAHPSWSEIDLRPRARALVVYQFEDGLHGFVYLDATRDSVNSQTLATVMTAADKLQHYDSVTDAMKRITEGNDCGVHSDFHDFSSWNTPKGIRSLKALETQGVVQLERTKGGRVVGIRSSKPIARKKIVIMESEQPGYRQFGMHPVTLQDYRYFLASSGADQIPGLEYNGDTATIQECFYNELDKADMA